MLWECSQSLISLECIIIILEWCKLWKFTIDRPEWGVWAVIIMKNKIVKEQRTMSKNNEQRIKMNKEQRQRNRWVAYLISFIELIVKVRN